MGKATRIKKNQMYGEYCVHQDCGRYQESLEQKIGELEYELSQAKEILRKYVNECPSKYSFEDIDEMAEQFLGVEK